MKQGLVGRRRDAPDGTTVETVQGKGAGVPGLLSTLNKTKSKTQFKLALTFLVWGAIGFPE